MKKLSCFPFRKKPGASRKSRITCLSCGERITVREPATLPAACPRCGADLCAEEVIYLSLIQGEPAGQRVVG